MHGDRGVGGSKYRPVWTKGASSRLGGRASWTRYRSPPVLSLPRLQADDRGVAGGGEAEADVDNSLVGGLAVGLAHRLPIECYLEIATSLADDSNRHTCADPAGDGHYPWRCAPVNGGAGATLDYELVLDPSDSPITERRPVMAATGRKQGG